MAIRAPKQEKNSIDPNAMVIFEKTQDGYKIGLGNSWSRIFIVLIIVVHGQEKFIQMIVPYLKYLIK
jgi:hypothetical protein